MKSLDRKPSYRIRFSLLAIACFVVFFLSFFLGRYPVNPFVALRILFSKIIPAIPKTWTNQQEIVVTSIRFPRIACAALVGAALSVAGACYQGMFRNPMVSPDLLGASTGAGFGAALAILLGGSYLAITLSSFAFGLAAVFLALLVSKASRMQSALALVLAGVMIGSLFSSGTSFVKLVADTESQLPEITYWLMGSLSTAKNKDLLFALVPIVVGLVPLALLSWRLNLLTVSEQEAKSMGIETAKLRAVVILCSTLMTAASVSISGMIGWVGLVIPHFCRILFGQDFRRLIPASALLGATYLMVVDDLARVLTATEIPLGILTAFVGAPVFLYLIISGGTQREH
ncbi:MAG: iron ABC transporter permease [Sphaerochaetaceae bacterium]|nr:iron ABC transporter permease [Sphaerochaetaceae bacterium]